MPVVQLPPEVLRSGQLAPVSVRDAEGRLLLGKGVLLSEEQRKMLVLRPLYVDESEGEVFKRSLSGKLDSMLRQNASLGQLATARADASALRGNAAKEEELDHIAVWSNLQVRTRPLMQDPAPADFTGRLHKLQADLLAETEHDADLALLYLVQTATGDTHQYSTTHALLVAVLCELASRQIAGFAPQWRESLRCAALTMNMSMTVLQDQLAAQEDRPTPKQQAVIDAHCAASAVCLRTAGVADPLWLGAVEQHHASSPEALSTLPPVMQLARLLQRADIFAARLSKRRARPALSGTDAVKAAYLNENGQADEAGKAIIQSTGIYPPGSYVRLANGELAVVLRRGANAKAPKAASIVSRSGSALMEPTLRDTKTQPHEVIGGVAPHEVKVRVNLEKLLRLA